MVRELQPNLVMPEDTELQDLKLRQELLRRRPLMKFNALLFFGEGARSARGCGIEGATALGGKRV